MVFSVQRRNFSYHRKRCENEVREWGEILHEKVTKVIDRTLASVLGVFEDEEDRLLENLLDQDISAKGNQKAQPDLNYSTVTFLPDPDGETAFSAWLQFGHLGLLQVGGLQPHDFFVLPGEGGLCSVLCTRSEMDQVDTDVWRLLSTSLTCTTRSVEVCGLQPTSDMLATVLLPHCQGDCGGDHELVVKLLGRQVRNSPFSIRMEQGRKAVTKEEKKGADLVSLQETKDATIPTNTSSQEGKVFKVEDSSQEGKVFKVGDSCLARWPDDQVWYRARVDNVEGGVFSVTFVDYENEDRLSLAELVENVDDIPMDQRDMLDQFVVEHDEMGEGVLKTETDEKQDKSSKIIDAVDLINEDKFTPGQVCLARWSEDQTWYRSRVEQVGLDGCTVTFTDYDNKDYVVFSDIVETVADIPGDQLDMLDQFVESPVKEEDLSVEVGEDLPMEVPTEKTQEESSADNEISSALDIKLKVEEIVRAMNPDKMVGGHFQLGSPETTSPHECVVSAGSRGIPTGVEGDSDVPDYCPNDAPSPGDGSIFKIGDFCLARWSDLVWYRARVEKVEQDMFTVTFIDYDNTDTVSFPDIVTALEDIPRDQLDMLDQFVENPELESNEALGEVTMEVIKSEVVVSEEDISMVKVVPKEALHQETTVVEELCMKTNFRVGQQCLACWSEDQVWYRARVEEVKQGGEIYRVAFIDYDNSETVTVPNIVAEVADIPSDQVDMLDQFVDENEIGTSEDFKQSPNESEDVHDLTSSSDCSPQEKRIISCDSSVDVEERPPSDNVCGSERLVLGQMCVARWSEDLTWYRARVEEVRVEDYLVTFVDYDNSDTVRAPDVVTSVKDIPVDQLDMVDQFVEMLEDKEDTIGKAGNSGLCEEHGRGEAKLDLLLPAESGDTSSDQGKEVDVAEEELSTSSILPVGESEYDTTTAEEEAKFTVGQVCLARWSEDQIWYRARVDQYEDGAYTVTFYDYDNQDKVFSEDLVEGVNNIPLEQRDMLDQFVVESVEEVEEEVKSEDIVLAVENIPRDELDMVDNLVELVGEEGRNSDFSPKDTEETSLDRGEEDVDVIRCDNETSCTNGVKEKGDQENDDNKFLENSVDKVEKFSSPENHSKTASRSPRDTLGQFVVESVEKVEEEDNLVELVGEEGGNGDFSTKDTEETSLNRDEEDVDVIRGVKDNNETTSTSKGKEKGDLANVGNFLDKSVDEAGKLSPQENHSKTASRETLKERWVKGDRCRMLRDGRYTSGLVGEVVGGHAEVTFEPQGDTDFVPVEELLQAVEREELHASNSSKTSKEGSELGPGLPKYKSGDCCIGLWQGTWYNVKIIEVRHDGLSARVVFTDYLNLDILPLTNLCRSLAEVGAERLTSVDRYLSGQGEARESSAEPTGGAGSERTGLGCGEPPARVATQTQFPEATSPARLYGSLSRPADTCAGVNLARTLRLKSSLVMDSVRGPMFLALLSSGDLLVGTDSSSTLQICDRLGHKTGSVSINPHIPFRRPRAALCLSTGHLVVLDTAGLHLFEAEGGSWSYVRSLAENKLDFCSGLAEDREGRLVIINHRSMDAGPMIKLTERGETDIFFIDIESGKVVKRVEMVDIITDKRRSFCTQLVWRGEALHVLDFGLSCVYLLYLQDDDSRVEICQGEVKYQDPSGMLVDDLGNILVTDRCNNSVVVMNNQFRVVSTFKIDRLLGSVGCAVMDEKNKEILIADITRSSVLIYSLV